MVKTFVFSTISGGYFVSQTALITIVKEVLGSTDIDALFGNSGGAIANLLSLKYSGTKESIERVLYSIDKNMFIKPWVSENHPLYKVMSPFVSLFKGSFYKASDTQEDLVSAFFTETELKNTEMWIGKYDISSNFTSLLCSKSQSETIFSNLINTAEQTKFLEDMSFTYRIEYANGNIKTISDTLNATSAIPGYKPAINIDGVYYVDGGVSSASPGSSFVNILTRHADDNNHTEIYRFFYIVGDKYIDEDIEMLRYGGHWSKQISGTLKSVLNASIYRERQLMFQTWLNMANKTTYKNTEVNFVTKKGKGELKEFYDSNTNAHMFVTCYSRGPSIDIINFSKEVLKDTYKKCYDEAFFEIFYVN